MSEELIFSEYDIESDHETWLKLHEAAFGPAKDTQMWTYLRWLDANPVKGNLYLAAYSGKRLVGFLGFMAQTISGMGHEYRAAVAVAAMSHPDFRGRAIYQSLLHKGFEIAAERAIDFCLGYTVRDYVLALELKIGWRKISEGHVLALPLCFPSVARRVLPRTAIFSGLLKPMNAMQRVRVRRKLAKVAKAGLEFRKAKGFGSVYDKIALETKQGIGFNFAKNGDVLSWKYLDQNNPHDYDIVEAWRGKKMLGCIVARAMDLNGLDGYAIVDFIAPPGVEEIFSPLLAHVLEKYAFANIPEVVACMVTPDTVPYNVLRRFSFIPLKNYTFSLIFHPTSERLPKDMDSTKWNNYWGNNDTV